MHAGVCAGLWWDTDADSQTHLPRGEKSTCRVQGDGAWRKQCKCPLWVLCWWVWVKMASTASLVPQEGNLHPPLFRKPSQKNLPSFVSGFPQAQAFTLHQNYLLTQQQSAPVFYLRHSSLISKLQLLGTWHGRVVVIIWGRVSPHYGWCQFVPEGQLHECTSPWSLWQSTAKSQHPS